LLLIGKRTPPLLWAVPVVALLMLVLTLIPAGLWKAPTDDAIYRGFDPNLVYASNGGAGSVLVSRSSIDLKALPNSEPTVLLATTLLPKLTASADVSVLANVAAGEPFRIGFWSPWTSTGFFVTFGPAPKDLIEAETVVDGVAGTTLLGGHVLTSTSLGHYQVGSIYTVALTLDKVAGTIASTVSGVDGTQAFDAVNSRQFPAIFANVQVSLAASSLGGGGTSHVVLRDYVLTLPHQRLWASKVDDPIERLILIVLALAGLLLLGIKIVAALAMQFPRRRWPITHLGRVIAGRWRLLAVAAGAVGVYLVGNALLFPLGGQPFDMGAEKLYAYVSRAYGADQLYYLPNLVSVAKIWGGVPYLETAFPYEPVTAYVSAGIGWITSILFASGGVFTLDTTQLPYVIKAVNVVFGLGDAALIYLILRQIKVSERWSLVASALFLFNPAVWFSMTIWGQTHVMSLFFVLAAVWFAEKHLTFWAWLALAAACLTRPQMLVFGLLLGIVFIRKFSWRENVAAVSWTVIVSFIAWIPLTLATSPSLPIDIMLNNFHVQEAGGNAAALTTVSQSAYSLWPLVTYVAQGASGLQRAFTVSSTPLVGSVTYQQVSQILTVAAMVLVSSALAFRKRAALDSGGYLPLLALGVTSFLMLQTGLVATHFLLALPFLLLCRRWMGTVAYFYVAVIWTVTTLVPMFGEMGVTLAQQQYPLLGGDHSAITQFFVGLYPSDRFITAAVVANICAVIWLAFLIFRPAQPGSRPT
jgi:hypothetical protein